MEKKGISFKKTDVVCAATFEHGVRIVKVQCGGLFAQYMLAVLRGFHCPFLVFRGRGGDIDAVYFGVAQHIHVRPVFCATEFRGEIRRLPSGAAAYVLQRRATGGEQRRNETTPRDA